MQQSNKSHKSVTDVDKINIISSQAVLEMSCFSTDTRSNSSSPLINSLFKNRSFKNVPAIDEPLSIYPQYGFVSGRHYAAWQPRSRNPQDWDLGCVESQVGLNKVWHFLTQQFNCCMCAEPRNSTYLADWINRHCKQVNTEWRQYDVIMTPWSSIEEDSKKISPEFPAV